MPVVGASSADNDEPFPPKPGAGEGSGSEGTASDFGDEGDDSVAPFDDDDLLATSIGGDGGSGHQSPSARLEADTSAEPSSLAALLRRAKTKLATVGALSPALREHVGEPALRVPDGESSPTPQRPAAAAGGSRRRGTHVGFVAAEPTAEDDTDIDGEAHFGFGEEDGDWDVIPMDLDEAAANADSADGFGNDTPGSAAGPKAADMSLGDGFLSKLLAKRKSVTLLAGSEKRHSTFADGDPFTAAAPAGDGDSTPGGDDHPQHEGTNRRTSTFFRARRRSFGGTGGNSRQGSFRRRSSSIGSRRSSVASSHFGSDDDADQHTAISSGGSSARSSAGGRGAPSFVDLMAAARRQGVENAEQATRNEFTVAAEVEFEHTTSLFTDVVLAEHSGFASIRAAAETQIFGTAEFLRSRLQRRDEPAARATIEGAAAVGAQLLRLESLEEAPARDAVRADAVAEGLQVGMAAVVAEEAIRREADVVQAWDALVSDELEPAVEELQETVREAQRALTTLASQEAADRSCHDTAEAVARDVLVLEMIAEPHARDLLEREGLVAVIDVARTVCEVEESFVRESIEDAEWALAADLRRVAESLDTIAREGASELALLSRIESNARVAICNDQARFHLEMAACEHPHRGAIAAEAVTGFKAIERSDVEASAEVSLLCLFKQSARDFLFEYESMARLTVEESAVAGFWALHLQQCEASEAVARHALKHMLRAMVREDGSAARSLAVMAAGEVASKRAGQGLVHVQDTAEPHARAEITQDEQLAATDMERTMAAEHTALVKGSVANAIAALSQAETAARFATRCDEDNGTAELSRIADRLTALHVPLATVESMEEPDGRSNIAADEHSSLLAIHQFHDVQARETNARYTMNRECDIGARKLEAHGAGLLLLATLHPGELRALLKEMGVLEKREHTSRRHIANEAEAERDALEHRISKKLKRQRRASVAAAPTGSTLLGDAAVPNASRKPVPPSDRPPAGGAVPRTSPGGNRRAVAVGFGDLSIDAVSQAAPAVVEEQQHASSPPSSPRPTRQSPLAKKAPSSLKNKWDRVLRELAAVDDAFEKSTEAPTPMELTARRRKSSARRRSSVAAPSSPLVGGRPPAPAGRRPSTVNDGRGVTTVGRRRSSVRPAPEPSPPPKSQDTSPGFRRKSVASSPLTATRQKHRGGSNTDGMTFDEPSDDLRLFSRRRSSAAAAAAAAAQQQQSPQPAPPTSRSPAKGSGASMRTSAQMAH